MRPNRHRAAIYFTAAITQVLNQLFSRIKLRVCWLAAIEISNEANA